ncbi:hypothetical protein THRCLA_20963 [Thraustotheca clavata]|uniref:Uncharacterized protein n=1 Tax=Thraustotheca clavata TaxID=74557 RepID=A0A1W0A1J4_9STRA|nr:hypothetical protein THRCLA_20963 [Thraustotheca clavata]
MMQWLGGQGQSRGFKIGSWAVAGGLAFAWYKYDQYKEAQFSVDDANEWNKLVLAKQNKKEK